MKKVIIIASAVIAMFIAVYTSIRPSYTDNNSEFIIVITIIMAIILGSSLALPGIKLSRPMRIFLIIISILFLLASSFSLLMFLGKLITAGYPPPSETSAAVMSFVFFAVIFISALIYIIRVLHPSGQTLFIAIGIACALVAAAGVMWYNPVSITYTQFQHKYEYEAYINNEQHQKEKQQIEQCVKEKNINGLIMIVKNGEIRSKEIAARHLGDFGDKSAIPALEEMNKFYAGFECYGSGEFAVAICKIKNKDKPTKKKINALMKLVKSKSNAVSSTAAIEISRLQDPEVLSVLPELRKINGYGAVQAVIKIESRDLNQEEKILKYTQILKEHKTPLLAEGAEKLLIEIGDPVVSKTAELLLSLDTGQTKMLWDSFTITATVMTRCIRILEKIGNNKSVLTIGQKIYDRNLYVKACAIAALQRITKENFDFTFDDLRMGEEQYQKALKGIVKAQEWWNANKHCFEEKK